jgi:hypothetical protein
VWKQVSLTAARWPRRTATGSGEGRRRGFSGLDMPSGVRREKFYGGGRAGELGGGKLEGEGSGREARAWGASSRRHGCS